MGKRKFQKKPSSLPKGLPIPKNKKMRMANNANINPFESARASSAKAPKFHVHNRAISGRTSGNNPMKGAGSALARAVENRKRGLKESMAKSKKAGAFVDRRIGESRKSEMTEEERMMARIIRERSRRSKKHDKFSLDDDGPGGDPSLSMTHRGRVIDDSYTGKVDAEDVILSDDEDKYGGQLERADTEMHFGGGTFDRERVRQSSQNPYGPSGGRAESIGDRYRSRKEELDDLIMRKKYEKAEKAKRKEEQVEKFEEFDDNFKELAAMLNFRDKQKDRKEFFEARKAGTLSQVDKEMDEWDKEMKGYLFDRRVKATDRTKTPEEIAKEESERLHELETRRLARMSGDFENDDFSDLSDDEENSRKKKGKKTKKDDKREKNPDELDSDEEDEGPEFEQRFTADGIVYVDRDGNVKEDVDNKNSGAETPPESSEEEDSDDLGDSDDDASVESGDGLSEGEESDLDGVVLEVGTKIKGKYLADQQLDGKGKWYKGVIKKVTEDESGNTLYELEYDDGDVETDVKPENVRRRNDSKEEHKAEEEKKAKLARIVKKRQKAKQKARAEIPFVFEVPTTLEALHDMIGTYAATGADASLIIERIHTSNSVRLDHRNKEKMQNFYDVLMRRFVGVGDALYKSGSGGEELGRYDQLDALTKTLYNMAQDAPDGAAAIWNRRLGIMQSAHAKRLRDSEIISLDNDEHFTAWPSAGSLLLLRSIGHIFPMTDLRHVVTTPALLLIGQILGQTPIGSIEDIIKGIFCAALMLEYTKEAKRIGPEALAFLAGVINLFAVDLESSCSASPIPSFDSAPKIDEILDLRSNVINSFKDQKADDINFKLSLEKDAMSSKSSPSAILITVLKMLRKSVENYASDLQSSEPEVFDQIVRSLLRLAPKAKSSKFPDLITEEINKTADSISQKLHNNDLRRPLLRRAAAKSSEIAIKSLAPRMEDPTKYAMGRDKNKTRTQAEKDQQRREYKREHKAVSRELRLDAAFVESERRKEKDRKDSKAREARNKNYSWMEQEQATMNQQVAQGGGLLKGGGTGAARIKAKSGKIGIKRGGKF